ncbi:MAG: SDR family oxidoreductase [SAR324 cluster bacterium]|nr:SDR family oxidoreductase [SAR324 cluster bacterium]
MVPDQKTKPQSILITGCSSGIGYYCAHQLHQRGYQVIASCRKKEDVQKLQSEGIECLELDLEDSQSVRNAFDEVMEKTGGELDALFNNGAFGQPGAVEDLPREVLRRQFETNVFGWHELTRLVLPGMIQRGTGRILQNSSVLGFVSFKYRGAYVASKFALEGLTDTLRLELHGTGVQVCLIEPGPILSEFRANGLKVFEENIDTEASRHSREYEKQVQRLRTEGPAASFTLGPEAVYQRVLHALESPNPKIRYYVTFPTYLMAGLKRILPHRWLDYFLRSNS